MNGLKIQFSDWILNEDFIKKNYNKESDEGYFLEVEIQYPEKLHELHNDLPLLPEMMTIRKVEKVVGNLRDKNEYIINITNLKQVLNHGLVLEKLHRIIKFHQNVWLKPYIDVNTNLKKSKKWFWKRFF